MNLMHEFYNKINVNFSRKCFYRLDLTLNFETCIETSLFCQRKMALMLMHSESTRKIVCFTRHSWHFESQQFK